MVERGPAEAKHRWQLVGGHPALDLANTVSWRLDPTRRVDRLTGLDRLADWIQCATGHDVPRTSRGTAQEEVALDEVRDLRDAFTRLLDRHLAGDPPGEPDLRAVEQAWRAAVVRGELAPSLPTGWHLAAETSGDLVHLLSLLVGGFLSEADLTRLRRCAAEGCGWFFLDTTRNHSRRWCDTRDCGNRTRVRRYAARRSQA
jgi:predicted RNA-binding Zn ribbon-like protein